MNFMNRKPREKDERDIVFDAVPPEALATERVIQYLRESEVMPIETSSAKAEPDDTRPPAHLGADRLDQIATRIRLLTYGQMMELSAETGISAEAFHKWSRL